MSLVGPRPERPVFVQELRGVIPYYDLRHTVRPGITGWAQTQFHYGASSRRFACETAVRSVLCEIFVDTVGLAHLA